MALAKEESEAEERRVEYVAATRAESVLLIGKPDKINSDYRNPWGDLLMDNLPDIPDYASQPKDPTVETFDDVMNDYHSVVNKDSNEQSYAVKSPSGLRIKTQATNDDEVVEEESNEINKALVGTLVHRLLECIVSSKGQYDVRQLTIEVFEEYGLDREMNEELFVNLCKVGETFMGNGFPQTKKDVPQDLFKKLMNAEEVMCELPFSYKSDKNIISGVIDLLYKDNNGWHIIDYKTNAEGDIKTLEEEYKGQLGVYKKAFKQATGLDCDAHIYHIDI